MPENQDSSLEAKSRFGRRTRRTSAVSREVILGLDDTERKISFVGGALALVASAVFIPRLTKNTTITVTAKYVKGTACPAGYHVANQTCEKALLTHPSYWLLEFILPLVAALIIFAFAFSRRRVGVIVASLMLGLAGGTAGVVFLFLGGWLGIRAFRLQKYGEASFAGSSRRARELGQERRAARQTPARGKRAPRGSKAASVATKVKTPEPSKRYTPKKTVRRK